jgi:hypothetical protein
LLAFAQGVKRRGSAAEREVFAQGGRLAVLVEQPVGFPDRKIQVEAMPWRAVGKVSTLGNIGWNRRQVHVNLCITL